MADTVAQRASPEDIGKIIEQAAKEPGVNDMMALLELARECNEIEEIRHGWSEQPLIAQVSSTGGWLR
jgi:hypothetical protein